MNFARVAVLRCVCCVLVFLLCESPTFLTIFVSCVLRLVLVLSCAVLLSWTLSSLVA
jgi:hypothetical protein